jgi:WD40 repeat protein
MRHWTCLLLGGWLSSAGLAAQDPVPATPPGQVPAKGDKAAAPPDGPDALPDGAIARLGTVRGSRISGGVLPHTLVYSPDGKHLASADNRTVHVWDAATGRELRQFGEARGVGPGSQSLAFAPDGKTVAAYIGGQIKVVDIATGREIGGWPVNGIGLALTFSPDGKHVVVVLGTDQTLRRPVITFWDPATGQPVRQIPVGQPGLTAATSWIAYAPDGRLLAVATVGRPITLIETATNQVRAELTVPSARQPPLSTSPGAIVFAADSRTLYDVTWDGTVAAWDTATGREQRRFGLAQTGSHLRLSADGNLLAVRAADGGIRLYEPTTGRPWQRVNDLAGLTLMGGFALAPDGATLAMIDRAGSLRYWDTATGRERNPTDGHTGAVTHLTFAPDSQTLVSMSAERVCVWAGTPRTQRAALEDPVLDPRMRALSPGGKRLAVVGATNSVRVLEVPGGKVVRQFDDVAAGPYGLAFTADCGTLAVSEGKAVKLWDLATGAMKRVIDAGPSTVTHVAFAPDGRRLAGTGGFGSAQVWDADTGRRLWEQPVTGAFGRSGPIFSPDGARLALSSSDGRVRIFDAATGQVSLLLESHSGQAPAFAFAPDGRALATGGIERQVYIWQVPSGRLLHILSGHQGSVDSLAYSPDGTLLASGGSDALVVLWDATKLGPKPEGTAAPEPELTDEQANKLWDDLAAPDAATAYTAIRALAAAPRASVARLRARLKPAAAADPQRLAQLIADLDGDGYERREKATRELAALGEGARAALEKFLAATTSAEARNRAQALLHGLTQPADLPEQLRLLRAVEILERIGTPDAGTALAELAGGLDGAKLTREARAALERLKKQ